VNKLPTGFPVILSCVILIVSFTLYVYVKGVSPEVLIVCESVRKEIT
jgi:hypothetical protein